MLYVSLPPYNADKSGETDVTSVIQKTLNDVGLAGGGVVYLPSGTYKVNPEDAAGLRIQYKNTVLRGAGKDSTFILNSNSYMREKSIIWLATGRTWSTETGTTETNF